MCFEAQRRKPHLQHWLAGALQVPRRPEQLPVHRQASDLLQASTHMPLDMPQMMRAWALEVVLSVCACLFVTQQRMPLPLEIEGFSAHLLRHHAAQKVRHAPRAAGVPQDKELHASDHTFETRPKRVCCRRGYIVCARQGTLVSCHCAGFAVCAHSKRYWVTPHLNPETLQDQRSAIRNQRELRQMSCN